MRANSGAIDGPPRFCLIVRNGQERKEAFLETLGEVQSEFNKKGIDYRVIGSVAGHAYLEPDLPEGVPTLDFNRKGAVTPDQLVPDIDIIVPRADLPEARVLRSRVRESDP